MTVMLYHNESVDAIDDLVRSPALDRPMRITRFPSQAAQRKKELRVTLRGLAGLIESAEADDKWELPWFKMAAFGAVRTPLKEKLEGGFTGNSLRHDANVLAVTGVEADYDGEQITPEDARDMLREAGVAALVYTTPSHSPDAPRWRVFAPFSEELSPDNRTRHMERLNGVLGGNLDGASFALSQSYFGGSVTGRAKVKTFLVDGRYIDPADELDSIAKGKPKRVKATQANDNRLDETATLAAIMASEDYHGGTYGIDADAAGTSGIRPNKIMKTMANCPAAAAAGSARRIRHG